MTPLINIMVIEDHPEFREALGFVLTKEQGFNLVASFGNAELGLRSLEEQRSSSPPDIILLDLNLPGVSGLEALPWLQKYSPEAQVIILSQMDNEKAVLQAIQNGVAGYLLKSSSMDTLITGIKEVHQGGGTIDPKLAKFVLSIVKGSHLSPNRNLDLSKRQIDVITLVAQGLSQKQIALELGLSTYTVTDHLKQIYDRLQVQNAPEAVAQAFKQGII